MKHFFTAEWTVLVLFEFSCNILAVFCCCVILAFAFCTLKGNDINRSLFLASHFNTPKHLKLVLAELPSGIGPLTSALPMLCSTN